MPNFSEIPQPVGNFSGKDCSKLKVSLEVSKRDAKKSVDGVRLYDQNGEPNKNM